MEADDLAMLIDSCLTQILEGRQSLDQCLADYPDQRESLAPLLRLALNLAGGIEPSAPDRKAQARATFIERLQQLP